MCLCVCVCVCVCCVFLSVCYYCFFSDCRIYLFSSLAARVFNKLTRYSLKYLNLCLLDNFDNKGRKVSCKVSLYKNSQRQSCSTINCLSSAVNILAGMTPSPEILAPSDPPPPKGSEFWHIFHVFHLHVPFQFRPTTSLSHHSELVCMQTLHPATDSVQSSHN